MAMQIKLSVVAVDFDLSNQFEEKHVHAFFPLHLQLLAKYFGLHKSLSSRLFLLLEIFSCCTSSAAVSVISTVSAASATMITSLVRQCSTSWRRIRSPTSSELSSQFLQQVKAQTMLLTSTYLSASFVNST